MGTCSICHESPATRDDLCEVCADDLACAVVEDSVMPGDYDECGYDPYAGQYTDDC